MSRTVTVSVAVAGLAAAALAAPAVAETWRPAPPPDPYAPMLAAMQRDLALTPDQARGRLEFERRAHATTRRLRGRLGSHYAGAWLSPDGRALTVAVTDPARQEFVRAQGAQPRLVRHSAAALAAVQRRLARQSRSAPVAGWYVDVAGNRVVVVADGAPRRAREYLRRAGVAGDAVTVRAGGPRPRLYAAPRGGDGYRGVAGACSIGFAVEGGFVTAGHCGAAGSGVRTPADRALGTVASAAFPGDDYGYVRTADAVAPVVADHQGSAVPVRGAREAPVGASVCRSGRASGWRCGVVTARDATVRYAEGTVTGLTRTDVCAEPGDSGGSWISDGQAQGVTSGGTGDCVRGGETYFQPLGEVLEAYGLNLRTEGAPAGAPAGCAGLPVREPAALGPDAPAFRPNATYYVAAGRRTHRACVAAAGAAVRLVLQRWTGQAWVAAGRAAGTGEARLAVSGPAGYYRVRAETAGEPVAATVGYDPVQ